MPSEPACPRCKTNLLVADRSGPDGERFVCHGCEQAFSREDVPYGLREGLA